MASGSWDGTMRLWDVRSHTHAKAQRAYFTGTIEPLHGIDLCGLDFTKAIIEDPHDREVLWQNGVKV